MNNDELDSLKESEIKTPDLRLAATARTLFERVNRKGQVNTPEVLGNQPNNLARLNGLNSLNNSQVSPMLDLLTPIGRKVCRKFLEDNSDILFRLDIPQEALAEGSGMEVEQLLISKMVMLRSDEAQQIYDQLYSMYNDALLESSKSNHISQMIRNKMSEINEIANLEASESESVNWLEKVTDDGMMLRFVPDHLKTPEVCLAAVQQDGRVIQYLTDAQRTLDVIEAAVRASPQLLDTSLLGVQEKAYLEYVENPPDLYAYKANG